MKSIHAKQPSRAEIYAVAARALIAFLLATSAFVGQQALAQTLSSKIAPDLAAAILAPVPPQTNWSKLTANGTFFKVIIVGTGSDPSVAALRSAVTAEQGSVSYRYQSIQGISATLPKAAVNRLAQRSDVQSISPNRPATQSTSFLAAVTGRSAATATATTGSLDGTGVGIAILDSGAVE